MTTLIALRGLVNNSNVRKSTFTIYRQMATRKRFYRKTGVLYSDGKYEVTLDQRKLKTPNGQLFTVTSEPLAVAVATEWDSQKDKIQQSNMHLTALCSTVIDNPNRLQKSDIVQYILNYLETDTVLFQSSENDDLYNLQLKEWDPIINWFCKRFNVNVQKFRGLESSEVSKETKNVLQRHLMSYNFEAINGYVFGVNTLKSVILTLACMERFITAEKAVLLSRLEEEYQLSYWGRVEWAHELSQQDLQARLSAAVLFVHFNSSSYFTKIKNVT